MKELNIQLLIKVNLKATNMSTFRIKIMVMNNKIYHTLSVWPLDNSFGIVNVRRVVTLLQIELITISYNTS